MSSISRSLQTSAAGVGASTASGLGAGPGASPRAALHDLQIRPIPHRLAKQLLVREHYLHSMPGGTMLSFGAFHGTRFVGALTLGVGPKEGHRLISNSRNEDCATLTRFWMDDAMPANCESRVLGIVLRSLRRHTGLKFILSYADPSQGHIGTIYQAAGWIYTGLSSAASLYDIGDGVARHSRSLGHAYGSHSVRHFADHGIAVTVLRQTPRHRYLYPIDKSCANRLRVAVMPYPKKEPSIEHH